MSVRRCANLIRIAQPLEFLVKFMTIDLIYRKNPIEAY